MPPAVNRSALALYSHRLAEDGCRFRLHASSDKSPYLYVREIVDGERLRQFSLAPLEWVARAGQSRYEQLHQRRPRSLGTDRTYLRQIGQLRGKPRTQALREWACQADPASSSFTVRINTQSLIRDGGSSLISDSLLSELRVT